MTTLAARTARAQRTAGLVGHHYRVSDFYEVGREKIREFAKYMQDPHPAHRSEDAARVSGTTG